MAILLSTSLKLVTDDVAHTMQYWKPEATMSAMSTIKIDNDIHTIITIEGIQKNM